MLSETILLSEESEHITTSVTKVDIIIRGWCLGWLWHQRNTKELSERCWPGSCWTFEHFSWSQYYSFQGHRGTCHDQCLFSVMDRLSEVWLTAKEKWVFNTVKFLSIALGIILCVLSTRDNLLLSKKMVVFLEADIVRTHGIYTRSSCS